MLNEYAVKIRRELHEYPEIGFDLPRTLALLRRELDAMGVEYTEQYGKSSIVATINPQKDAFTIGIRADMDALPITELTDVPFKSKIDGQMHACGHDAHTAILLATLKELNEERDNIACRVKFLFQPAEEYTTSGAKLMAEDGVMDDIDTVIALHVDVGNPAGQISLAPDMQGAISDGFKIVFHGRNAHVANQESGTDAIMMAVRAYTSLEFMIAKEFPGKEPVLFNVGRIEGGMTNNVIADSCMMFCTLRTWTEKVAEKAMKRIHTIIEAEAAACGGTVEFIPCKHYPNVYNDPKITELVRIAGEKVLGAENVFGRGRGMGGEDFAFFAQKKPGCMFRLGVKNVEQECVYAVHNARFKLDEEALDVGVKVFKQFVYDNMNGIK